jgi:plasmid stabilization system protein ParE
VRPAQFRIRLTRRSEQDIQAAYEFIAQDSPQNALNWYEDCLDAIERLRTFPRLSPLASEPDLAAVGVRSRLTGRFRILHLVQDDTVIVIWIRHTAMRPLTLRRYL